MNKPSYKLIFNGELAHESKYQGGFVKTNGRSNNSPAYNHDYYMRNKSKWKVKKGSSGNGGYTKQEEDMYKDIESGRATPEDLFFNQDFDLTLAEFGGYDTDNMDPAEKQRLKENYMKRYSIVDNEENRRLHQYDDPSERRLSRVRGRLTGRPAAAKRISGRGDRMGNGMPSDVKRMMDKRKAFKRSGNA
jgi:hypothetical protein